MSTRQSVQRARARQRKQIYYAEKMSPRERLGGQLNGCVATKFVPNNLFLEILCEKMFTKYSCRKIVKLIIISLIIQAFVR